MHYYALNLRVDPNKKAIRGYVDIEYNVVENFDRMLIDLFENMKINRILQGEEE